MARFPDSRISRCLLSSQAAVKDEPSDDPGFKAGTRSTFRLQWRDRVGFTPTSRGRRGERRIVCRPRGFSARRPAEYSAKARELPHEFLFA